MSRVVDSKCRRCGSHDHHERFELTEGRGDWCNDGWHDSREVLLGKLRASEAEVSRLRQRLDYSDNGTSDSKDSDGKP